MFSKKNQFNQWISKTVLAAFLSTHGIALPPALAMDPSSSSDIGQNHSEVTLDGNRTSEGVPPPYEEENPFGSVYELKDLEIIEITPGELEEATLARIETQESNGRSGNVRACSFLLAGAAGAGCVLMSIAAKDRFQTMQAVSQVAEKSRDIKRACRHSDQWIATCRPLTPEFCGTPDAGHGSGSGNGGGGGNKNGSGGGNRSQSCDIRGLSWPLGDCGEWKNLQRQYFLSSTDLTELLQKCPNYPDYQDFLNSSEYQKCQATFGPAQGEAIGLIIGTIGTCAIVIAACALKFSR